MAIDLTKEQQEQLARESGGPEAVRDPRSNEKYVLLPIDQYEQIIEIVDDDNEQRALRRVASRNLSSRLGNEEA